MSIAYCNECKQTVEGNTHGVQTHRGPITYIKYEACNFCDEEVIYLNEDDPKEER